MKPAYLFALGLSLLVALILVSISALWFHFDTPLDLYWNQGVVKLKATDGDGRSLVGSGFIVQIDRDWAYVVTAAHVVPVGASIGATFSARRRAEPVPAQILHRQYTDEQRGLALLKIPAAVARSAGALPLPWSESGVPAQGQEVTLLGHPRTVGDWSLLHGWVSAREGEILKVQAAGVNEGSSGGPVLWDGRVVGVVVEEQAGIAIVKPGVSLRSYLEGHDLSADSETPAPAPPKRIAESGEPIAPPLAKEQPEPAKLAVQSNVAGDMVSVDGERRGPTPLDLELAPGTHAVRIEKDGYQRFETEIKLRPGGAETVRAKLVQKAKQPGETFRDCADCPEMVVIPAGTFQMGSPEDEEGHQDDEGPLHSVTFARPFAIAKQEVSFDQWDVCVADGGCSHQPEDKGWGRGRRPVINVSWDDAQEYLSWLGKKTGEDYRLPSEAQWEYAARAGTTTARFWGDDPDAACAYANVYDQTGKRENDFSWTPHACDDSHAKTAPVGSFEANGFGLQDMLGNVWEWTADCWNGSYAGAPNDGSVWSQGDCDRRVLRGGSWFSFPEFVRSADRFGYYTGNRNVYVGFRPARTL